jgi:hypothetical protein
MGSKYLGLELSALGGSRGLISLGGLGDLVSFIVKTYYASRNSDYFRKAADMYLVPYGSVIRGLQRTKTITKGDKKSASVINLVRPSQKLEMITPTEKSLAKNLEGPWDDLANLAKTYSKGVPARDIYEVRENFKKFQTQQFENNSKLNSWSSKRRAIMCDILRELSGKKRVTLKAKDIPDLIEYAIDAAQSDRKFDKDISGWVDNFSPYHLANAIGADKNSWLLTRFKFWIEGVPFRLRDKLSGEELENVVNYYFEVGLPSPLSNLVQTEREPLDDESAHVSDRLGNQFDPLDREKPKPNL